MNVQCPYKVIMQHCCLLLMAYSDAVIRNEDHSWSCLQFSFPHSLRRHVEAVNKLADRGLKFWDYGNAFLLEASRAGKFFSETFKNYTVQFKHS